MSNPLKYSTSTPSNALRKGNVAVGVNGIEYGPTISTNWYSGVLPTSGNYVIYKTSATGDPDIFAPQSDDELYKFVIMQGGNSSNTTSVGAALAWIATQSDLLAVNNPFSNIVTDGLVLNVDANAVGSYPTTGTPWYDLSGDGNNGTLTNGPTFNTNGWFDFDGTDDYVNFGNPTELNFTGDMSHEIWFTRNSNAITNLRLTAKGAGGSSIGQKGFSFFGSDNSIRWAVNVGGVRDIINATITTDRWYHVVGTADLTNSTQSIYLNGEFVGQQPITGTGDMVASNDFLVGSYFGLANYFWDGKVGSTKVYSKALSLGDVKQNYNATKTRYQ